MSLDGLRKQEKTQHALVWLGSAALVVAVALLLLWSPWLKAPRIGAKRTLTWIARI